MSKKLNPDRELIVQKYVIENKLLKQVATELGCGRTTISRYLNIYKIEKRDRYELHKKIFSGEGNPFYGKKHVKETRDAISKTMIDNGTTKGKNNPRYIDGRDLLPYPSEFNQYLKDKIRKRDNYTCQNCAMTEEEHMIVLGTNLHTHHIDYIKENCNENNLITLCNCCNTRANYNRSYWQSFFTNKIGQVKHDNV